ncbi:MAG: HPr family phosphocarrier protein [Gammaproteobacteria bacterium]|nr:HPr family phosphocarrier protein [Gammaproteobacteria bacterium]
MQEQTVIIVNKLGLHARAASKFVNEAKRFGATIQIEVGGKRVDGKSIMSIMLLAASKGQSLTLRTTGDDEAEAMNAITALIANRFGEDE